MAWIFFVLFYGLAKGGRELIKKKAMEKNTVVEVLFFYTLLSFLFVIIGELLVFYTPLSGVFKISKSSILEPVPAKTMLVIAIKSFIIFIAWICGFSALNRIPLSLYGVLDLGRVVFATLLGVIVLNEEMTSKNIVGTMLVILGLLLLKLAKSKNTETIAKSKNADEINEEAINEEAINDEVINEAKKDRFANKSMYFFVLLVMISCFLNAVSGILDKVLMTDMESGTLQFWYMLYLTVYYGAYAIIKKEKLHFGELVKNPWIWGLSLLFVLADRALFLANAYPESQVTVMTLIKQSCCVVTILGGKFIYKEKNIGLKLICAGIVVAGILLSVL